MLRRREKLNQVKMKKFIILIVLGLAMSNLTFGQSPLVELDRVKEIKLLESNRDDVRKILADYNLDISDDSRYYQWFSTKNAHIMVRYSNGKCSNNSEYWNIPEWKVTSIDFSPKNLIKIPDIKVNYSKFRKERKYVNLPHSYTYHNKDLGIAFEVDKNEIQSIYLFPSKKNYSLLCDNEIAKKFYSNESWFVDSKLKERRYIYEYPNRPPDVINLILSQTEITANCNSLDLTQNDSCSSSNRNIVILVNAKDPENDVLIYNYKISGGKIIGQGSSVVWDLSGVETGTYTITATADDGRDFYGKAMTKTVVVKQCSNCQTK